MLETTIQSEMRLANVPLRDAQLPAECLVVSIRREDELLSPAEALSFGLEML